MQNFKLELTKRLLAGVLAAMTTLGVFAGFLLNEVKNARESSERANQPVSVNLRGSGTEVTECFGVGGAATSSGLTRLTHDDGTTRTATTTLISACPIDRATDLAFNYIIGATTTRDVDFVFQFSHDGSTWFNEVTQTADSNTLTTIGGGTSTPRRVRVTNGTTTKQLPLIAVAARHARVLVQSNGTGTGSTSILIWGSFSKREGTR